MKSYTVVLQGPQESTQVEGPLEAIELDVFEDVEGSRHARSLLGGRHVTAKDLVRMVETETMVTDGPAIQVALAKSALRQILDIGRSGFAGGLEDIETAQEIARCALAALTPPK